MAVNYEQMKSILSDNERVKITSRYKYMGLQFYTKFIFIPNSTKVGIRSKEATFLYTDIEIFWLFPLQRYL